MTVQQRPYAWALAAAFLFALMGTLPAQAADAAKVNRTIGNITAVSMVSITIQPERGGATTFVMNDATKVRLDGKPASRGDLKVGQRVRVNYDGKNALEISNRIRHKKSGDGQAPATPAPPAATQ